MKKYAVGIAALLLVALMLSLVSCTDDFKFIDKSGNDTTAAEGEGNPSSDNQGNGQGDGNGVQSGNQSGSQSGGYEDEDEFYKDGWGSPITY